MKKYIVWFMFVSCIAFDITEINAMHQYIHASLQPGDQHVAVVLSRLMLKQGDEPGGASAYKDFFDQRNITGIARKTAIVGEARKIMKHTKERFANLHYVKHDVNIASAVDEQRLNAIATTHADSQLPTLGQHLGTSLYDEQGNVTEASIDDTQNQIDAFHQALTRHWVYRLKQAFAQYKAGHSEALKSLLLEDIYHNPVIALPIVSRYFKNDQVFFGTLVKLATTEEERQKAAEIIGMEKERIAFIDRNQKEDQRHFARVHPNASFSESTRADAAKSIQRAYRKKKGYRYSPKSQQLQQSISVGRAKAPLVSNMLPPPPSSQLSSAKVLPSPPSAKLPPPPLPIPGRR